MIISQTPFRVSFFGGGTDFPEFYHEHGGATLLTTINQYCYISIHRISKFFQFRFRASYAKTELVQNPSEFQHPLIRECLLSLNINDGLEITHASDLPGRTGLGSSSSFTVGLLNALHAHLGREATAEQLAQESIRVERERVGDPGGQSGTLSGYLTWAGRQEIIQALGSAAERARKANEAEARGDHDEAKRLWQIVLGSSFPK